MHSPKTIEEARQHRYGVWAGDRKGRAYVEGRCAKEVSANGWTYHQCTRKSVNGLFCKQHAPKE